MRIQRRKTAPRHRAATSGKDSRRSSTPEHRHGLRRRKRGGPEMGTLERSPSQFTVRPLSTSSAAHNRGLRARAFGHVHLRARRNPRRSSRPRRPPPTQPSRVRGRYRSPPSKFDDKFPIETRNWFVRVPALITDDARRPNLIVDAMVGMSVNPQPGTAGPHQSFQVADKRGRENRCPVHIGCRAQAGRMMGDREGRTIIPAQPSPEPTAVALKVRSCVLGPQ